MKFLFFAILVTCLTAVLPAYYPGTPFIEPINPFDTQFSQDFRRTKFDDSTLRSLGPAELLKPESAGLKIAVAKGASEEAERVGIAYPLPLAGDADVRASVELLPFPKADGGYGTGVVLALEDGVERGATLQFLGGDGGNRSFVAHHFLRDADGNYDHQVTPFSAGSAKAVLRMRREGSKLTYLVSENEGAAFDELKTIEFTDQPLKVVQLYGQRGGQPNALAARLFDFSIASPQVTLRSEAVSPKSESNWWLWVLVGGVLLLFVVVGGVWYQRRYA